MDNRQPLVDLKSPDISIVVPTYREADNIPELAGRIDAVFEKINISHEIIIVDDYSGDGTEGVIERLQNKNYPIKLITRLEKRDLSSAVLRGFNYSSGNILVCMDADLSHPPESLPALIGPLKKKEADFVIGSRYVEGGTVAEEWSLYRWLNSKLAAFFARPLTRVKDPMSGFFAISNSIFQKTSDLNPLGYKIGLELLVKCNPERTTEVPIHFAERKRGRSKLSIKEQLKYIKHVFYLLLYKFFRFSRKNKISKEK